MTTSTGKPGTWIASTDLTIAHELNDGGIVTAIKRTAKTITITATINGESYTFRQPLRMKVLVADNG